MSRELWQLNKHVIPASHIRGLDRGVRDNKQPWLRLAVNQYQPLQASTDANAFTIIVAAGIGSAKECYEPLFDDLLIAGVPIRGVWIADSAGNGESFLLNEDVYGDEPSWIDYSRDIWAMINHFQMQMPPPLVGMGQSLGSGNLMLLSSWHPRLFDGIIAMEPALGPSGLTDGWPAPNKYFPGVMAIKRKDQWPSREIARKALKKNQYYGAFDERVFEKVVRYELVEATTPKVFGNVSMDDSSIGVTLTTPKHMESYHWMLPDPPLPNHRVVPEINQPLEIRRTVPGFHRADAAFLYRAIPLVYPPVLYVWADSSIVTPSNIRSWYLGNTGTGLTGSGGVKAGAVEDVEIEDSTHPVCLEKPKEVALATIAWFKKLRGAFQKDLDARSTQASFRNEIQPAIVKRVEKL